VNRYLNIRVATGGLGVMYLNIRFAWEKYLNIRAWEQLSEYYCIMVWKQVSKYSAGLGTGI
jgi:hypothetical protein